MIYGQPVPETIWILGRLIGKKQAILGCHGFDEWGGVVQGHLSKDHLGLNLTALLFLTRDHHHWQIGDGADESIVDLTGSGERR